VDDLKIGDLTRGMTLSEVCKAYPDQAAEAIQRHAKEHIQVIALLEECLVNGNKGSETFYAWFCGEHQSIKQAVEESKLSMATPDHEIKCSLMV